LSIRDLSAKVVVAPNDHWFDGEISDDWTGQIAEVVQVSRAAVACTLGLPGVARLATLTDRPLVRYEWRRPGQMMHLDIKNSDASGTSAIGSRRPPRPGAGHRLGVRARACR
jgi:hypothetical protein